MSLPSPCAIKGCFVILFFPIIIAAGAFFVALCAIYLAGIVVPRWLSSHGKVGQRLAGP